LKVCKKYHWVKTGMSREFGTKSKSKIMKILGAKFIGSATTQKSENFTRYSTYLVHFIPIINKI
jgi:hypothetical protein